MHREDRYDKLETPISDESTSDEVHIKLWTKYSKYSKEQLIEEVKPKLSEVDFKVPINMQKELIEFYVRPEIYINQLSEIMDLRSNVKYMSKYGDFPDCPLIELIEDPVYSINEMIEEGIPKIEAERIERLSQELSSGLK